MSYSCIVFKWQEISTRFLLHATTTCLSQIAANPFLPPQISPKVIDVDMSVGDTRWRIAAEWSEISQCSQWRAYRKPPSFCRMVSSLTPKSSPSFKIGVPNVPRDQLRDACCHLWNMIEDIDKISFAYDSPIER